ncbi:MAG: DUF2500 domain-containing protein [Clostridia bacterium]|nr:DUF2500 domain-containing protein [Clostridia bacterium]
MFEMFYIMFFLVIGIFIFAFVKIIGEWSKNNNSPRLSVEARIVDKRSHTSHHHHNHGGHMHTSHSTSYYVTFEVQSGDRMELRVPHYEFGLLVEGDVGTLSFQGTRYLGFARNTAS